jgi:ADP-heptose:LPS heptosyltransferase
MKFNLNKISRFIRVRLARFFLDSEHSKRTLDISKVKSVLFIVCDDRVGDMVVMTMSFREIKKKYPHIKVNVLCSKNSRDIIKYNKNVDGIYEMSGNFRRDLNLYKKLSRNKGCVAVDFFDMDLKPLHLLALRNIKPYFLIGFHKSQYKIFDKSIDEDFNSLHITHRHNLVLKFLGIDNPSDRYDIFFSQKEIDWAAKLLSNCAKKYRLIINPFASSKHRTFEVSKLVDLIKRIKAVSDISIFVLCPPNKRLDLGENFDDVYIIKQASILSVAALIKECDCIITPDTSIVHIASAFDKKTIGLYLDFSNRAEKTDIIWAPNNPNAKIINADVKNGARENDIKNISNEKIVKLFLEMKDEPLHSRPRL